MDQALADFLRHLGLEKNASAYTVKSYREDLTQVVAFFRERAGPAVGPYGPGEARPGHFGDPLLRRAPRQRTRRSGDGRFRLERWRRDRSRQGPPGAPRPHW